MPIVADTKNWTWVLERPCPECGFDSADYDRGSLAPAILKNATAWPAVLLRADVRVRPNDSTWSPLEYSAHVRDVLAIYRERLRLMITEDNPLFPNWDQDVTAVAERYNEQEPLAVASALADGAAALAADCDALTGDEWSRPGRRSDGSNFTVESLITYMVHDLVHHLWDVRRDG
jgi:hypothetical protein